MFRRNAGLMRCMNQLSIELPGFNDIGAQANLRLAHRVVSAFEREVPPEPGTERHRLAMALNCIAMVDGVLRKLLCPQRRRRPFRRGTRRAVIPDLVSGSFLRVIPDMRRLDTHLNDADITFRA